MTATFWVRDDDACDVSLELERLHQLASRHELNIGLAVIPGKVDRNLVEFLEREAACFFPMCHGWKHVNYGRKGQPAEFGSDRPPSALSADGQAAFEAFSENFGSADAVFVPPFGRITDAMVEVLPKLGFVGVSKGPGSLERRLSRVLSRLAWAPAVKLPSGKSVPHFDVHIDPIDWHRGTARHAAAVSAEIIGHLRLRRKGFISPDLPIGLLTHHLVHDKAVWDLCDDLIGTLRRHGSAAFAPAAGLVSLGSRRVRDSSNAFIGS